MASETIEIKKEFLYELVEDIDKLQAELETILNPDWEKAINQSINEVEEGKLVDRSELERLWKERHV
ncbi:MAG: hypothetical protein APG12_00474 [Candidatus Methanofastidiosum methylothiophilum]|uniref:Addiction module component n=1 Tax=Candidatus Methanofastidiosum methylothiophilum TaxID=1705564 RepID=A0A150ILR9_9EURY|nr:MAG: hypothetical protein APG10_00371 [Candidatus Methanofastidiosum methylthiophilus]KYC48254.1 MAG: hypothetical protein APG11_00493 [Candidatus Methanofastidiosum methylthiophilus]KYC50911.1 MAG: hypothetical protein APG12_00474 [Candidatus Methanofastidiosum methylthiophilus]